MSFSLLDNVAWHALNSYHRRLAIQGQRAARYQPDVFFVAAMAQNEPAAFHELRTLVAPDETIIVAGSLPPDLAGWAIMRAHVTQQMVCEELTSHPHRNAITLTATDVPDMLELVRLTQPGPFLQRTIEMGQYIGLREEGKLVAMAGERVHLPGFCEISAICTHPDYRGRGYGAALTTLAAARIMERQEIPFLHVLRTNAVAMKLYEKSGFRFRKEIELTLLKRLA
ncbi:MAG: GNAT family N-acetyltransferase [Caldilineaceae bacterium]